MKCSINIIFLSTILMVFGCSNKISFNCTNNNNMSKNNINPENNYVNRRELKTTLSKSDFDLSHEQRDKRINK